MVRQLPGSSVTVSTIEPLPVIWQLLPQAKAKRQSKGLTAKSIGDLLPAQLWLVWLTSTNTGVFLVVSSHCWPWPGRLRRMCYYSCWTDSVWESESFQCFVNIRQQQMKFLMELARNCCQSKQHLLLCSVMLNHLIISWSLSKNTSMTYNKNHTIWIEILCRAADLNWEQGVCSDSNWSAQLFKWLGTKA